MLDCFRSASWLIALALASALDSIVVERLQAIVAISSESPSHHNVPDFPKTCNGLCDIVGQGPISLLCCAKGINISLQVVRGRSVILWGSVGISWVFAMCVYICFATVALCSSLVRDFPNGFLFEAGFTKRRVFIWFSKSVCGPFGDPTEIHMAFVEQLLMFFTCVSQLWPSLPVFFDISLIILCICPLENSS